MAHGKLWRGRIAYRAPNGSEIGREFLSITTNADGTRSFRAQCEMDGDNLTRDVTYTVNSDFKPRDATVRLIVNGAFQGSGWFRFTDQYAEAECFTATEGRVSQRIDLKEPARAFGTHPICSDIWRLSQLDPSNLGQDQWLENCINSSPLANGGSGPLMARRRYRYTYKGEETLTTDAGTFACRRFDWHVWADKDLQMWYLPDDFIPVRMFATDTQNTYDLVELDEVR